MLRDLFSLFPAYAGVIPGQVMSLKRYRAFPRIRGGDPVMSQLWALVFKLFPAYAGVIPTATPLSLCCTPFPRIRGGDPGLPTNTYIGADFSPHMRG